MTVKLKKDLPFVSKHLVSCLILLMSHFHIRVLISTADKQWKCESPCRSASIFTQVLYMSAYIQSTDDKHCKQYWQSKKS